MNAIAAVSAAVEVDEEPNPRGLTFGVVGEEEDDVNGNSNEEDVEHVGDKVKYDEIS